MQMEEKMKKYLLLLFLFISTLLFAEWTILQIYPIPEGASGLAFDGTYLYCGIYGANGDEFYRIYPDDGSFQLQFSNTNIGDCFGLTFDGTNLWATDHVTSPSIPATAYELDINSGAILSQFDLPVHYMSGIAYDDGDFWVAAYYDPDGQIYKIDNTGVILQQFAAPDNQPWDLCLENENLWMADYWGDALYKIDPVSGTLLEIYLSEGVDPAGIVWDGQYLWYCDNGTGGNDYLYKVDLGGVGTPAILLGWDNYDFGNTTVGQPDFVELPVTNSGTADLSIDVMYFTGNEFYTDEILPIVITPNDSYNFTIFFDPITFGSFSSILTIESNDPVNPIEEVELSGYGILENPAILVSQNLVNYGSIRVDAVAGRYIEVSNQGSGILEINDITFDENQFFLDDSITFPMNISTAEIYDLRIWFNPDAATNFEGVMTIHSNDPVTPMYEVTLSGNGDNSALLIGEIIWQYEITTGYDNSPKAIAPIEDISGDVISDVIVCSQDNFTRCFNGNSSGTADILWEYESSSGEVYHQNSLSIAPDLDSDSFEDVIIGTTGNDRAIRAISGKTGEEIWSYLTNVYGDGGWIYQVDVSYDYNNDTILDVLAASGNDGSGTGPQRVHCLDGTNGSVIWEFYTPGPKFSVLGIEDANYDFQPDVICGASNQYETQGIVYGIDGETGTEIWSYDVAGSSVWALEQTCHQNYNGVKEIIAGDFSGNYYCIDPADVLEMWTGNLGTSLILRFIKLDDVNGDNSPDFAIAHSGFHNVIVIDGFTGDQIWSQPVADQPWNAARVADISGDGINDLLVGTLFNNNYGYFLDGVTGSELGSINAGTPVDAIAGIPDVTGDGSWEMIIGGRDGSVLCVSGGESASSAPDFTIPEISDVADLIGNYPNPFNPDTSINFNLKIDSNVSLRIYNIKGQLIKTLLDEELSASTYSIAWNGKNDAGNQVSSGIYLYQLYADTHTFVRKCILLK